MKVTPKHLHLPDQIGEQHWTVRGQFILQLDDMMAEAQKMGIEPAWSQRAFIMGVMTGMSVGLITCAILIQLVKP